MLRADQILGPYRIVAPLGAGGMGEVYKALDTRLRRNVAIKALPPDLAHDEGFVARFEREAQILASLSHPNIVAIHDVQQVDGNLYVVLELLEGETLRQRIDRGPMPWSEAASIGASIADGLAAAHAKGIIHRDLKPENIFITNDGHVKVLDFGIARTIAIPSGVTQTEVKTMSGGFAGTIAYMAPEQIRGESPTAATDLFALGAVLHEMVTGQRLFARATGADSIAATLNETAAPPGTSVANIPPEFDEIVSRCLQKKPAARFQSAADLAFALRALTGRSSYVRATNRQSSKPGAIWIAAAAVIAVVIAIAIWKLRPAARIESIAVLPFRNADASGSQDYLSDGLSEVLIQRLSQLPNIRVLAMPTVLRYKTRSDDPIGVGRDLHVDAIMTGQLMRQRDKLMITTNLIRTADGSQIWGERYSRDANDIFAMQDEIALDVSSRLERRLTSDQKTKLTERSTESEKAYDLYLQGRFYWNKRNRDGLDRAEHFFKEAIAADPNYARAYSGLADTYGVSPAFGGKNPRQSYELADVNARKALALDPNLAEAHASLGYVMRAYRWDFDAAEREFRTALQLNPNYASAHQWYGMALMSRRKVGPALEEIEHAVSLDPMSFVTNYARAFMLYYAHRFDEAVAQARKTIQIDPTSAAAYRILSMLLIETKHYDEALQSSIRARELAGFTPEQISRLRDAYTSGGWTKWQREQLDEKYVDGHQPPQTGYVLAQAAVRLGDREGAFRFLEMGFQERAGLQWMMAEPDFEPLQNDPRFQSLARRVGFR